jgi:hypothetical protein
VSSRSFNEGSVKKTVFKTVFIQVLNVSSWAFNEGSVIEFVRDLKDPTGLGTTRTAHGKPGGRVWVRYVENY